MSYEPDTPPTLGNIARRDRITEAMGRVLAATIIVLLLLPPAITVLISFSNQAHFAFPPTEWGLRQYRELIDSSRWIDATLLSLRLGVIVVAVSTLIVVPATFAAFRSRLPGRHATHAAGVTGIIIPISAYAVGLYAVFSDFGLLRTQPGIIISHTTLAVPAMLLVVSAGMSRLPVELELAAMVAGAGRARALTEITLRLLIPSIFAGGMLAFIASFDESVFIIFLAGPGQETLPKAIFNSVRIGVDPVVTAIATLLMVGTSILMGLAGLAARRT